MVWVHYPPCTHRTLGRWDHASKISRLLFSRHLKALSAPNQAVHGRFEAPLRSNLQLCSSSGYKWDEHGARAPATGYQLIWVAAAGELMRASEPRVSRRVLLTGPSTRARLRRARVPSSRRRAAARARARRAAAACGPRAGPRRRRCRAAPSGALARRAGGVAPPRSRRAAGGYPARTRRPRPSFV